MDSPAATLSFPLSGEGAVENSTLPETMEEPSKKSLHPQIVDYVASAAKAALALGTTLAGAPFAGPLLIELATAVIPKQRTDRIAKFAEALEEKLSRLEEDFIKSQLTNENFTDLAEEGIRQAARSLSGERREYIASLITDSLSSEDIEHQESKHLLRILGEINDIEVLWLRFYLVPEKDADKAFREKHRDILNPAFATSGSSQEEANKAVLQESYKEHLARLGLLEHVYETEMRTGQPKFDNFTGGQRVENYRLTSLGRLLLRMIGLAEDKDAS